MNQYEAIFVRKSVRSYQWDPIEEETEHRILSFFGEQHSLFGDIRTEVTLYSNLHRDLHLRHVGAVKAPYYLIFYSEKAPRYEMNLGYLMQQMSLYLTCLGLGSCILACTTVRPDLREKNGLPVGGLLAFGHTKGSCTRKESEARRLPMEQLCVFKEKPKAWTEKVVEAARMAPSAMNDQPWRFVCHEGRLHIFTKKHKTETLSRHYSEEISFGAMFANILVACEELWIDVDLIRLENITQKNFPNNQYVLTAVMRN